MACPGHSAREPKRPRFECVICIPILLAASAATHAVAPTSLSNRLTSLLARMGGSDELIASVQDFLQRYPDFETWTDQLPEYRQYADMNLQRDGTPALFYASLGDARDLFLLAIILINSLRIPTESIPEPIQQLIRPWR